MKRSGQVAVAVLAALTLLIASQAAAETVPDRTASAGEGRPIRRAEAIAICQAVAIGEPIAIGETITVGQTVAIGEALGMRPYDSGAGHVIGIARRLRQRALGFLLG